MAAAVLQRLCRDQGRPWSIASAGLLGHDGDPAEPEARQAMLAQGLNIDQHRARSIDPAILADSRLLICIDSGTAQALRIRFPAVADQVWSLGDLAGRKRDIPDPFRMQIGAWLTYAEEISTLLRAAMPRIRALMGDSATTDTTAAPAEPASASPHERIHRMQRLLTMLRDMPAVIEWGNARHQLEQELRQLTTGAEQPAAAVAAYATALHDRISACQQPPGAGQIALLLRAIERLQHPIDETAVADLQADLVNWPTA